MAAGRPDFDIARAGWMFRQSSILKRWKKNWFSLTTDGTLRYFESQGDHMALEAYEIPNELTTTRTGDRVRGVTSLPEGLGRSCLLELELSDTNMVLCAESLDDMSAWHITLEQARVMLAIRNTRNIVQGSNENYPDLPPEYQTGAPPPYTECAYGDGNGTNVRPRVVYAGAGDMHYGAHPPHYVVQDADGRQTIVIMDDDRRRRCDGGDLAVGMMAGAAMGSLMWGPLLFW